MTNMKVGKNPIRNKHWRNDMDRYRPIATQPDYQTLCGDMKEDANGEWVKYEEAQKEIERLRKEMEKIPKVHCVDAFSYQMDVLKIVDQALKEE